MALDDTDPIISMDRIDLAVKDIILSAKQAGMSDTELTVLKDTAGREIDRMHAESAQKKKAAGKSDTMVKVRSPTSGEEFFLPLSAGELNNERRKRAFLVSVQLAVDEVLQSPDGGILK